MKNFKKEGSISNEESLRLNRENLKKLEREKLGAEVGNFYKDFLNSINLDKAKNERDSIVSLKDNSATTTSTKVKSKFCSICKQNILITKYSTHLKSVGHLMNKPVEKEVSQVKLASDNVGFQIMLKKGWNINKGLGASEQGMKIPLQPKVKLDKLGIGIKSKSNKPLESVDEKADKIKRKEIEKQYEKDKQTRQNILSYLNS